MARLRREKIPKTATRGRCPWCGQEPFFVDVASQRTWHPWPPCEGYTATTAKKGHTCLGVAQVTNLEDFKKPSN